MMLAGDECTPTDVRHQPSVAVDAVGDHGRNYELRPPGRRTRHVKLEDSQIQRAMAAADDFHLISILSAGVALSWTLGTWSSSMPGPGRHEVCRVSVLSGTPQQLRVGWASGR